jgi:hypothetical protein
MIITTLPSDRGRATSSMIDTFFTMINASELDEETLTDLVDRMLEDRRSFHSLENSDPLSFKALIRGFLSKGMAAEKILAKLGIATASTKQVALTLVAAFSKNGTFFIGTFAQHRLNDPCTSRGLCLDHQGL